MSGMDVSARDASRQPLLSTGVVQEHGAILGDSDTSAQQGELRAEEQQQQQHGTFNRNLGTLEAFAIIISIVIGSGIFTSPGSIDTNVPSPGVALAVWLVGGLLAWTGAATLAELGTAVPGEGGVQHYLRHIFGDVLGFLAGWTWVVAIMPATLAILSIVFVESIYSATGVTDQAGRFTHKVLSVTVMIAVNGVNCMGTKVSTYLNNVFVVTKFASIAALVAAGLAVVIVHLTGSSGTNAGGSDWHTRNWFAYRNSVDMDGSETVWAELSSWELLGHVSTALYGALWAYSGWDKAIYVSAELSQPARQLPLAINTAVPTIILCFLAVNAAYYVLLPWDIVSTTDSVAVTAVTHLLGSAFGIIAAILICVVVAGALLGNSFIASRMTVAAAKVGWFPSFFAIVGSFGFKQKSAHGRSSSGSDAPRNALLLSTIISAVYILLGNFRALVTFNGLGEYTFFFLVVIAALVLRRRSPGLARPYKTALINPIVFALVSAFIVARGSIFAPVQSGVLVLVWLVGLAYYATRKWWQKKAAL